jgi:hypothetical protein
MRPLFRNIGLGVVMLLPGLASCPRPMPSPASPPQDRLVKNPLVPGAPHARTPEEFREQLQTYLRRKQGAQPIADGNTRGPFTEAMAYGSNVPGVVVNPQAIVCGDRGCFLEVRYTNQLAVAQFRRRMIDETASPFFKWHWGAGFTVPEPVPQPGGALVSTWYFNIPKRWKNYKP